jgi:hypothetical protein
VHRQHLKKLIKKKKIPINLAVDGRLEWKATGAWLPFPIRGEIARKKLNKITDPTCHQCVNRLNGVRLEPGFRFLMNFSGRVCFYIHDEV